MAKPPKDKHSNIFLHRVSDKEKSFITLTNVRCQSYKTFLYIIDSADKCARVFVFCRPFHSSQAYVGNERLKGAKFRHAMELLNNV